MSDNNIELSRRRILAGLGTIGVASAATGAGTMALFSDEETSSGNVVQAGTLDLKVGNQNPVSASFTVDDLKPGESGGPHHIPLTNSGSLNGYLNFALVGSNHEGINTEAETDTEGKGDLGDVLEVTFTIDGKTASGTFNEVFNSVYDVDISLDSGDTKTATVSWHLPSSAGNEIQGDKVVADVVAFLHQKQNQQIGQTFDLTASPDSEGPFGEGSANVVANLVTFDTSNLVQPASEWSDDNVGFWFGDGNGNAVELKYNGSWSLKNNSAGASLDDFSYSLNDDEFAVRFDGSTYTEFGLYVEQIVAPSGGNGDRRVAVVTEGGDVPWRDDLVTL
mgnify:CR=1 FL=1